MPARGRAWNARGRLEAVIATASMSEADKSAWCRDLEQQRDGRARWPHRGKRGTRKPTGHEKRQEAHQGARARAVAQGSGAGRDGSALGAVEKSRGDLQQGRGRMIVLADRQALASNIAHLADARLLPACESAGITPRTLQRWNTHDGLESGDRRPQAQRPTPSHALNELERAQLIAVVNEPRFAAVPPARIVPMLADEGVYLASESSFSRVLAQAGQNAHRGRAKAPAPAVRRPPTSPPDPARCGAGT